MGDLSSPKRREVFDRLRRRYEFYRRHQNGSLRRFENTINGLYEQQRQDTVLLHQRWLESRAKKVSKQSKASKESNTGHGTDPRNLVVTQRLKKKIDSSQTENPQLDTSAFDFDDSDTTTTKKTVNAGLDVSVHIVQQISGNSHPDQKIQTNVNVSTTVKTHYSSGAPPDQGTGQSSTNVETSTSFECKQEPGGDDIQCGGSNQSDSSHNSSDILNQAELDDILNTIDNGDSEISDELIEELKKFDQIYSKVLQEDSNDSQDKMFNMTSTSPVLQKGPGPYPDATPAGYDTNQNLNPVRTPPMPQNFRSPLSETGPAAETLKQMAAQHQSLQQDVYGMKTMDDTFPQTNTNYRQNGYPPNMNHQQHFLSQQAGYIGQQHGMNNMRGPVPYGQGKTDMSLTYGGTKPLSHFSTPQGSSQPPTPSSLQQLQNQVQAHFDQGTQMEITQTQHMQVSDGPHRMQMSQTQQLQMRQPHQIAMSQHQSFSMPGGNMTPNQSQYMNEQMNMEMVEKMRKQQQQQQQQQHTAQSQHPNQQQQQQPHSSQPTHPQQQHAQQQQRSQQQQQHNQQQQTMMDRQQAAQMQQYMSRPPPEYKMQQSSQGAPEGYTPNGVGSNPLQTMQNMVNQTNTMQTAGYGQIKSESMQAAGYGQIKSESSSVQMHNGMMQGAQMSTLQRMNSAGPAVGMPGPVSASPVPGASAPYAGQPPVQRQQSYPGTQISAQETRQQRPGGTTYTSAIMRNQRPPNVNVGPDGLNISQPRSQHEWPRQMVPGPQGPRYAAPPHQGGPGAMSRPQMSAAGMMQYGSYSNQCGTMNSVAGMQMQRQTRPMQMSAMQSQQAAMMQGSTQQMMMQQQNMQISQRMNIRGPIPGASGTMAPSMDANAAGYNATPSGTHGHQEDFINLLDSAQTGNSDFIDGITVQSSDGNNDANWLDEILGAK